jgi:hypothetical protein
MNLIDPMRHATCHGERVALLIGQIL